MTTKLPTAAALVTDERRRDLERHLRWLGADRHLRAELAQEAMVRLWRSPPDDTSEPRLSSWLRTVARNLFRTAAAKPRPGVPLDDDALLEAAWRRFRARDTDGALGAALADCIEALPSRAQQALQLRYRHDLTFAQLAAALGRTVSGAKDLLVRIRRLLADCIDKERTK